jgi:outer membrane protein TolC
MRFRLNTLFLLCSLAGLTLALPQDKAMAAAAGQDYQALSLEDCLAIARKQNPILSGAREKINELVADYNAARSKFFPRLVMTSYYER